MASVWEQYKALPPRTRMYMGLAGMAFAWGGLKMMDALEESLDPAHRPKEIAPPVAKALTEGSTVPSDKDASSS